MPGNSRLVPRPKSSRGDFYVVKDECLACGMPHVVAPDLIGWVDQQPPHCYWKKQPETPGELERAIEVLESQDLECLRYAGTNPAILDRVSPEYCDHPREVESVSQPADVLECTRF